MTETRHQDEIIAEVRAIREALAAEHDYDVDRLFEALRRRERESQREVLEPSPKRISVAGSA